MGDSLISGNKAPDRIHLIFHQCYERRNHYRRAGQQKRRQLIAERLSSTCRHNDKSVFPVKQMSYNFLLVTLESSVSEEFLQFGMNHCRIDVHRLEIILIKFRNYVSDFQIKLRYLRLL